MPYDILKLKKGQYEVVNTDTGEVHAKQTTLAKAKAQVRLLGMKHAKGGRDIGRKAKRGDDGATVPFPPPPPEPVVQEVIFPTHQQLQALYQGHILPAYQAGDFALMNAELDIFIDNFEIDDDLLNAFNQEDVDGAMAYGNIFQLVADAEALFGQYVAPENVFALDSLAMDFIVNGEAGEDLGFDADDLDPMFGNGYYRMKNGCSLYTGGSSDVDPINYNSELKNNSWLGYGYGGRSGVLPVNYNSEMTRSFNDF